MFLPLRILSRWCNAPFKTPKSGSTDNILLFKRHSSTATSPRNHTSYTVAFALISLTAASYYLYLKNVHPTLSTYTRQQIADRRDVVWMTHQGGVYDLTTYAREHHPGGENIIVEAAGGDLEDYWEKYKFHQRPEIVKMLETMRIGDLVEDNAVRAKRCKKPKVLPKVDPNNYRLELTVNGTAVKSLTLEDIKNYPKHSIVSAIPCKSNEKQSGAVIKPTWTGTRLCDILLDLDVKKGDYNQVQFECLDAGKSGVIPIFDEATDVLLAYEMDGTELPIEHGYPIRMVMPQLPGRKNVKWLRKIVLMKDAIEYKNA